MTWKSTLLFIANATLLILLSGWLSGTNLIPLPPVQNFTTAEWSFMQVWLRLALGLGLILPGVTFLGVYNYPKARKIFGIYLVVLIVQIATERLLSQVFPSGILVVIGMTYTVFRIWQLWKGQQMMRAIAQTRNVWDQVIKSILWLLILFWSTNLVILIVLGWLS